MAGRPVFIPSIIGWLAAMSALAALAPLGRFPIISGILYTCAFLLMLTALKTLPANWSERKTLITLFVIGLAARVIFLATPPGNDINRYIWEGAIQWHGYNPYLYSPDSPVLAPLVEGGMTRVWNGINHKNLTAAYPPFSLLLFRALAGISPDPLLFKIAFVLFDLALLGVLVRICRNRRIPAGNLLLYAANPLVIAYVAGEGHLDIVEAFFLCGGILLLERRKHLMGFGMLGLAVISKYLALVALPFLIGAKNWKKSPAVLLPFLLFLPYADAGPAAFQSLTYFGLKMHYNDAATALIRAFFTDASSAWIAVLLLAGVMAWIYLVEQEPLRGAFLACGGALLLLPTLHPWYLVLVAPFMVFYPSAAWLYLQAAVALTFPVVARELSTGTFQEIHWIKVIEYGPFFVLLLRGMFKDGLIVRNRLYPAPESVSVIVPTLNEELELAGCLASLADQRGIEEVIVADGGSSDETARKARALGAKLVHAEKGRGLQIRAGTQQARGDMILVLHADCRLNPGAIVAVLDLMTRVPSAPGGAVGMQFENEGRGVRMLAFLNNLRLNVTGIAFGDQAQFFRRSLLEEMGGFPAMMLMEDVELSMRLKTLGRPVFLREGVTASGRRWLGAGFSAKFRLIVALFLGYLVKRRFLGEHRLNRRYYRAYYEDS